MFSHLLMIVFATSTTAHAEGASMEIIPTLWPTLMLTIPFLVAMIGMHVIFFGPLYRYLEERTEASLGARQRAKALEATTDDHLASLEANILAARKKAGKTRNAARSVALTEERTILSAARSAAETRVASAVEEVHKAADEASLTLKASVATLSAEISEQILGRSVSN